MSAYIDNVTILNYNKISYPDVIKIVWRAGKLKKKILSKFNNLRNLDCRHNNLLYLNIPELLSLTKINCKNNKLEDLTGLHNTPYLVKINCSNNNLKSIKDIQYCKFLTVFNCSNNILLENLHGLKYCKLLEILYCRANSLRSFKSISLCNNIKEIYCRGNKIESLDGLQNMIHLEELYCFGNRLRTLNGIEKCKNLKILDFNSNQLTTLSSLIGCTNIVKLYCRDNQIQLLHGLEHNNMLQIIDCSLNFIITLELLHKESLISLDCSFNRLQNLFDIYKCNKLKYLSCTNNRINNIDGIESCIDLKTFICDYNRINKLDNITNLRNLRTFSFCQNPIIYNPNILRFLKRIGIINDTKTIYTNSENIHDNKIQKSINESIISLIKDDKPLFHNSDLLQSNISQNIKSILINWFDDNTLHAVHNLTIRELFEYIWQRICKSNYKCELLKILQDQVLEAEHKCFTGKFNRLLAVLVGFYDDIHINISDHSQISAIIISSQKKIIPYCPIIHKQIATDLLINLGYSIENIYEWIEAIE